MSTSRLWVLVVCGMLLVSGCASRKTSGPSAVSPLLSGCSEATYQGRFTVPADHRIHSFRLKLRLCQEDSMVLEIRGGPGVAALVAGVRGGRALLLFPGSRRAVEGDDTPAFWRRWTGVPVSGPLVRAMLEQTLKEGSRRVEEWELVVEADQAVVFPQTVQARGDQGETLNLFRTSVKTSTQGVSWPRIPSGFDSIKE